VSGDPPGEELVQGVRIVRLSGPVRAEIESGPVPEPTAQVETAWERMRALNPRLFDGPVLSVRSIDARRGVVQCALDSYKRLVVQPVVETGVQQLSVTGVLIAADAAGRRSVLLGRRSHRTRMYGGMWQNCPAGGIDPDAGAREVTQEGIAAELIREVKEEAGLEVKRVGVPVAAIYDEVARSHDLIVPVEVGDSPATVRGWEYDELRWVDTGRITEFEAVEAGRIMAITRAVFRLMGWVGMGSRDQG
jgi:8-oxo-dGTP pyrophosphatase MutT (NUDIX family)